MVPAESAFHERANRLPVLAIVLAALLHGGVAVALLWASPLHSRDIGESAIDVTLEEPKPAQKPVETPPEPPVQEAARPAPTPAVRQPEAAPSPPPAPPPAAAPPKPEPQAKLPETPASREPLGVSPPPPAAAETAKPGGLPQEEAKRETPATAPEQEAALAPPKETPPPAPEPPLEKVLPPVETPPAPLTMRDFVKLPPPPSINQPTPQPQPAPPQPQRPLQHSPLATAPTAPPDNGVGASGSTFVNPSSAASQSRAKDAYLMRVFGKFAQYLPDLREKNEGGTVVLRFTIARDGHLVDASIVKSSGVLALDKGMLETLRVASPYPPLPAEIPGSQVVFVQPIGAVRR